MSLPPDFTNLSRWNAVNLSHNGLEILSTDFAT